MKTTDELTHELLLTDCVNMGHADLKQWLDAAFCAGLDKAVQLLRKEINTCHGPHSATSIACQPCVARENSIVDIEAYRDRHGKSHVCPVCEGDGTKECDVVTTTGTVKQYDGPCDKCGGTGLVKPSASVQPLNAAPSHAEKNL